MQKHVYSASHLLACARPLCIWSFSPRWQSCRCLPWCYSPCPVFPSNSAQLKHFLLVHQKMCSISTCNGATRLTMRLWEMATGILSSPQPQWLRSSTSRDSRQEQLDCSSALVRSQAWIVSLETAQINAVRMGSSDGVAMRYTYVEMA